MVFLFQYFNKGQRLKEAMLDIKDIAANDYTVNIKNIPKSFDALEDNYKKDLKEYLEQFGITGVKLEIININFCYDLRELQEIDDKRIALNRQKQIYQLLSGVSMKKDMDSKVQQMAIKIQDLVNQKQNLQDQLRKDFSNKTMKKYFVGQAFVTFQESYCK